MYNIDYSPEYLIRMPALFILFTYLASIASEYLILRRSLYSHYNL